MRVEQVIVFIDQRVVITQKAVIPIHAFGDVGPASEASIVALKAVETDRVLVDAFARAGTNGFAES